MVSIKSVMERVGIVLLVTFFIFCCTLPVFAQSSSDDVSGNVNVLEEKIKSEGLDPAEISSEQLGQIAAEVISKFPEKTCQIIETALWMKPSEIENLIGAIVAAVMDIDPNYVDRVVSCAIQARPDDVDKIVVAAINAAPAAAGRVREIAMLGMPMARMAMRARERARMPWWRDEPPVSPYAP